MTEHDEFPSNMTLGQVLVKHGFSSELQMLMKIAGGFSGLSALNVPANIFLMYGMNQAPFSNTVLQWGVFSDGKGFEFKNCEHVHRMVD